jgi:hypothetical protein
MSIAVQIAKQRARINQCPRLTQVVKNSSYIGAIPPPMGNRTPLLTIAVHTYLAMPLAQICLATAPFDGLPL